MEAINKQENFDGALLNENAPPALKYFDAVKEGYHIYNYYSIFIL